MNFKAQPTPDGPLCLSGHLSIEACEELRAALAEYVAQASSVQLDLSGVESADACALQLLISAGNSAASQSKPFTVSASPEAVLNTARELGIEWQEANVA